MRLIAAGPIQTLNFVFFIIFGLNLGCQNHENATTIITTEYTTEKEWLGKNITLLNEKLGKPIYDNIFFDKDIDSSEYYINYTAVNPNFRTSFEKGRVIAWKGKDGLIKVWSKQVRGEWVIILMESRTWNQK